MARAQSYLHSQYVVCVSTKEGHRASEALKQVLNFEHLNRGFCPRSNKCLESLKFVFKCLIGLEIVHCEPGE